MINLKEIVWVEKQVESVDYIYYDGLINNCKIVSITAQYNTNNIFTGYKIAMYINTTYNNTKYKTLELAKSVAKKKVEDFVLSLIDIRDYKIDELLK